MRICVTGSHADGFADLRLGQGETRAGRPSDGAAIGFPLVADGSRARRRNHVHVRERVAHGERLVLGGCARDRHSATWRVVDIGHHVRQTAAEFLCVSSVIGKFRDRFYFCPDI